MSSIIPFRFGASADPQGTDFSALLSARTESINTSALAYERLIPAVRDWTNQEMADLARVQYLLSRAGVPLETDRGLTDEGDPWFVFCDANGEVFVHICRLGMTYLLDGPSLEAPLRGPSFDALVKSFIDRATAKVAALNVVPLNKDNKLFLHPSVMLTALIWSLFLLNDQMTNAAYASAFEDGTDGGAGDPQHYDVETAFTLLADALRDQDLEPVAGAKAISKIDGTGREGPHLDKIGALPQSFLSPAVVTSLSAIALAFGLLQPAESYAASLPEITVASTVDATEEFFQVLPVEANERHVAARSDEGAHVLEEHQLSHDVSSSWFQVAINNALPDLTDNVRVISLDLLGVMAHSRDLDMSEMNFATTAANPGRDFLLHGPLIARNGAFPNRGETAEGAIPATTGSPEAGGNSSSTATLSIGSQSQTFAQLADQIIKHAEGLIIVSSADAHSVVTTKVTGHVYGGFSATYTDNTSEAVKALLKFEMAELWNATKEGAADLAQVDAAAYTKVETASGVGVNSESPPPVYIETANQSSFAVYSAAARDLVDYLLSKQKDIIVITLANEIVILDKSALDEASDVAYAKSWSVEGGGVVSTIGHFADYKDFGLI